MTKVGAVFVTRRRQRAFRRVVSFRIGANWLHECEWRAPDDIVFDLAQCIVLVPDFEQAEIFRLELEKVGRRARGFLPLHDLFAAL